MSKIQLLPDILPKDHFCLESSYDIDVLTSELRFYDITTFAFTRIYNDFSRFVLCNRPDWMEHCYNNGYVYSTRLNRHPSCYQSGYYIWDTWDQSHEGHQVVGTDAAINFDIGHGFTILEKHENYIDKYEFTSTAENRLINNFYINHLKLLLNFINRFKVTSKKLTAFGEKHKGIVPLPDKIDMYSDFHDTKIPNKLSSSISSISHSVSFNPYELLTKRELECIYWLSQGKTSPEISIILNVSSRTTEKFIASIKNKLGCNTLFQLGMIVNELFLDQIIKS